MIHVDLKTECDLVRCTNSYSQITSGADVFYPGAAYSTCVPLSTLLLWYWAPGCVSSLLLPIYVILYDTSVDFNTFVLIEIKQR